jgi:hypothetical protein
MSVLGTKRLNILKTQYIQPINGESVITTTGNIEMNDLTVTKSIYVDTINSAQLQNGNTLSGNIKVKCMQPITENGNVLINGNVTLQNAVLYLKGNSSISYTSLPPPTNYTTHYGPMIQGTQVVNTTPSSIAISTLVSRNGFNFYYGYIDPLTISISCSYEVNWDTVIVVERYDANDVFEAEIDVPALDGSMRNHGTMFTPYDNNDLSTMTLVAFTLLDAGACNSGVYTYRFRLYSTASRTFYFNRTVLDTAGNYERTGSTVVLEEFE